MRLEEGLVEQARATQHDEAAVPRSVGSEVQQALHALEALALGGLVDVRPGGVGLAVRVREGEVGAVEGHEELWSVPYLGEGRGYGGLAVALKWSECLVGSGVL